MVYISVIKIDKVTKVTIAKGQQVRSTRTCNGRLNFITM